MAEPGKDKNLWVVHAERWMREEISGLKPKRVPPPAVDKLRKVRALIRTSEKRRYQSSGEPLPVPSFVSEFLDGELIDGAANPSARIRAAQLSCSKQKPRARDHEPRA